MPRGRPKHDVIKLLVTAKLWPEEIEMLIELSDLSGLSRSAIIGMAIRHYYKGCMLKK